MFSEFQNACITVPNSLAIFKPTFALILTKFTTGKHIFYWACVAKI